MVASRIDNETVPDLETILSSARNQGLSGQGELFSAPDLAKLGNSLLKNVRFEAGNWNSAEQVLEALENGQLVLIAYDKDGNNEPCLKDGAKAHWCVVNGYIVPGEGGGRTLNVELGGSAVTLEASFEEMDSKRSISTDTEWLYLLCYHGKSLHQAIWPFKDLWDSNSNLFQVGPDVLGQPDKYVFPKDGRLDELRQMIVIAK